MNQPNRWVPPGWQWLARSEPENGQAFFCPAGHIHLDFGNFNRAELLAFARMTAEAAARLNGSVLGAASGRLGLSVGFSDN